MPKRHASRSLSRGRSRKRSLVTPRKSVSRGRSRSRSSSASLLARMATRSITRSRSRSAGGGVNENVSVKEIEGHVGGTTSKSSYTCNARKKHSSTVMKSITNPETYYYNSTFNIVASTGL